VSPVVEGKGLSSRLVLVVVVEWIKKDWGIEVVVYKLEVGVIMIREEKSSRSRREVRYHSFVNVRFAQDNHLSDAKKEENKAICFLRDCHSSRLEADNGRRRWLGSVSKGSRDTQLTLHSEETC